MDHKADMATNEDTKVHQHILDRMILTKAVELLDCSHPSQDFVSSTLFFCFETCENDENFVQKKLYNFFLESKFTIFSLVSQSNSNSRPNSNVRTLTDIALF